MYLMFEMFELFKRLKLAGVADRQVRECGERGPLRVPPDDHGRRKGGHGSS
jgi:predicted small lipoprotein YifL